MLFLLGLATLVFLIFTGIELLRGVHSLKRLELLPALNPASAAPFVSIIVPARNEASGIQAALTSLLKQDYPAYEVIAVDDRSEDKTGEMLETLARENPKLRVVHLENLPQGWLGKNYASYRGAMDARGEVYLFTDADIVMEPSALSRSVRYLIDRKLDHVTAIPRVEAKGLALQAFVNGFTVFFCAYNKPWKASDPQSPHSVGIGAFNLLYAEGYRRIGTHQMIAMRPDDDMKLALLAKRAGLRQEVLNAVEMIRVNWYPSVSGAVDGLMKNTFAFLEYRLDIVLIALAAQFLLTLWPLLALFLTSWDVWRLNAMIVLVTFFIFLDSARSNKFPLVVAFGYPLAALLMMFILARSTALTLIQGGITWRGTRYSLGELKRSR